MHSNETTKAAQVIGLVQHPVPAPRHGRPSQGGPNQEHSGPITQGMYMFEDSSELHLY